MVAVAQVIGGLALLVLAARKLHRRPGSGDDAGPPAWMAAFGRAEPARAARLGALLGGANPKNLLLTVAAAGSIGTLGLAPGGAALAGVGYVLLASSTVLGAVAAHLVAPTRSGVVLGRVERFTVAHSTALSVVVLVVLGLKLLADGLRAL